MRLWMTQEEKQRKRKEMRKGGRRERRKGAQGNVRRE